jgi:multiple sugar transport system substrate-binding protein
VRRSGRVGSVTLVAALSAAAALAGCTGEPGATPSSPPTSAPTSSASAPPQTLRFSVYGGVAAMRAYRDIADAFEADHPGVEVVLKQHSDAAAAAEDSFADLSVPETPASGSPSASPSAGPSLSPSVSPTPSTPAATPRSATPPDVFLLDEHYLPDLVSTGRLHTLDDELEDRGVEFGDDFQRIALTAFSADSALQCMPFEMSPTVLFVNTRLVRFPDPEASPPPTADPDAEPGEPGYVAKPPSEEGSWRWADFAVTAREVARQSQVPGFRAVYLPPDADLLSALMLTAGGDIVDDTDEPSSLSMDSDAAKEVLTAYVGLARERSVVLTARQARKESPLERFSRGRLAFLFGTRADVPTLRAAGVPFDTLSVPGFGRSRTASATSGLCVDEDSPVRDLAVDFVAHAVSEASQTRAARSGALVPASLDVVNSDAFTQPGRRPRTVAPFLEGQKRSVLLPYSLGWRLAETRIEEMVAGLFSTPGEDLETQLEDQLPALDDESEQWFAEADPSS